MKVEVLYIRDCPNHPPTVEAVRDALREGGLPLEIVEIEISDAAQAMEFSFLGSPTVRVNGQDVEPGVSYLSSYGVTCRSYRVNGRRQGVPDREWIREAIRMSQAQS
jgi:hypothetical protein